MSETTQQTPVMPADLPPETWIPFEAFSFLLPGMTKLIWENGSRAGRLPAGRKFSRKSPLVHRAGDIAEFFRAAAAQVAQVDENNFRQPSHETIKSLVTSGSAVAQ